MNALAATRKPTMYGNATTNIVLARTRIAEALRRMIRPAEPSSVVLSQVRAMVELYSGIYGDLDAENNCHCSTTFARIYRNTDGAYPADSQRMVLAALGQRYMNVTYSSGTTVD